MLRRDLIATVLSLLPAAGLQSILADLEAAVSEEGKEIRPQDEPSTEPRTAVVDRVEDGTAVLLFEDEGSQEAVEATVLPEAAREEGVVLRVPEGDSLTLATVDRAATAERRQDAQDRFDELAERPPDSDDSGNATES